MHSEIARGSGFSILPPRPNRIVLVGGCSGQRLAATIAGLQCDLVFPGPKGGAWNHANLRQRHATAAMPTSYERAAISYLDANGRAVNTAAPGGGITATWL